MNVTPVSVIPTYVDFTVGFPVAITNKSAVAKQTYFPHLNFTNTQWETLNLKPCNNSKFTVVYSTCTGTGSCYLTGLIFSDEQTYCFHKQKCRVYAYPRYVGYICFYHNSGDTF